MPDAPVRYRSIDEDSGRWEGFEFRAGDVVISTRSKSGTTWMQMICALLIFQTPTPPAPLAVLSPWLDMLTAPKEEVYAALKAQTHHRFIKTHTPLDGIPVVDEATYIVVARHPLDMAVSLYYQANNLDRARMRQLSGQPDLAEPAPGRPPVDQWLRDWIAADVSHLEEMDSLPGVMWHLSDAWSRRLQPNVVLVHYDDLVTDLEGQMQMLARRLAIEVPADRWPALVEAATFASMSSRAEALIPNQGGIFKSPAAFFRRGRSGAGRELLSEADLQRYQQRVRELAPEDLVDWLHR